MPLAKLSIPSLSTASIETLGASLRSAPTPDLEKLAASAPTPLSLEDLARAVGVEQLLLARVSDRRQPLPESLVGPIARALGETEGAVRGSVDSTVALGFAPGVRFGPTHRPLPPDRCVGDPIYLRPVRATKAVTFGG